jgi:hypothetical protein
MMKLLLAFLYFAVLTPISLVRRLFSDPLGVRSRSGSHWVDRSVKRNAIDEARRML